ncbi:serine/threonine-protein kinase [Erythrobacter sp. JK5]|uniref:serine/threonine-protein kinase n=1 Tax=Erythrobacter sp. JK5 TaxID=2829500 RepID=UPI001BA6F6BB|nr:serine/threonine-protein kinase [Erythrobacter sp. JK5]QUL36759.1 serine/threonine protein kinase [Erythrobacter sp. JK5]
MDDLSLERKALSLFEAMLDIDEDLRQGWLREQVAGDETLLRRITALNHADHVASMQTGAAMETVEPPPPPDRVGAYRITGVIGSGGMGTVYAAEREEGDFEHSVAIKLIKPGFFSEQLIERFNRERQILAQLNHSHIARLFDGGATPDGQPYIVMERIDGIPLLAWIGAKAPDEKQKLNLFIQICEAAGYAHRNLIVHRDLTPANVLIDQDGQAKLIDFGIARPDGEEAEVIGAAPARAATLTPGYAAPERMSGAAATVLSDVFSAGRMLAEIMPEPRTREIDAIIAKATAEQPEKRYLSMDLFAEDIRLYLSNRPVAAMPDSMPYRFTKWVTRNKTLALLALALAMGATTTTWWWSEAVDARDEAEQRFSEVRGIANFMLFDLYDELEPISGNTKALSRIADEARAYLERLGAADDLDPGLRLEIARGYHRLSTVSGNPEGANLGRREDARKFLDRAIADLEALYRTDPGNADIKTALAEAHYSDAIMRFIADDDNEGAIVSADRSAALFGELMRSGPDKRGHKFSWYRSRLQAAKPFVWIDKGEEGVKRLEQLVAEIRADPAYKAGEPDARLALASTNSELGYTRSWYLSIDSPEDGSSLPPLDEAFEIYDDLFRNGPAELRDDRRLSLIALLFRRSLVLSDMEQHAKALADLEQAEGYAEFIINRDPDDAGAIERRETLYSQKVYVLAALGRNSEAVALARKILDARIARSKAEPGNDGYFRDVVGARQTYAEMLAEAGQLEAGCAAYREAERAWKRLGERIEISAIDQQNSIVPLKQALANCAG